MDPNEQAQILRDWAEIYTDVEDGIARAALSEARNTLHDLRERRTQAEKPSGLLIESHKRASERVDELVVALAPHRPLPPELLSQIFIHAMAGKELTVPSIAHQVPGILAQVCSQWRAVAHAEPRLWNHIRICSTFPPGALEAIRTIISRSGSLIMSVVVESGDTSVFKVLGILGSASHRIGALQLTLDREASEALAAGAYAFANLETLELVIHRTTSELAATPPTVTAFSSSDKLRWLNIGTFVDIPVGLAIPLEHTGLNAASLPWHNRATSGCSCPCPSPNSRRPCGGARRS